MDQWEKHQRSKFLVLPNTHLIITKKSREIYENM